MIPCAFFSDGLCVETMENHIKKGLEFVEGLYLNRKYNEFLAGVLEIEPEIAGDLLRKAYAPHDIGKCLEVFQLRRRGFGFHEFYSFLVAREVFKKFEKSGRIASVAILLHHHDWIRNRSPPKPENPKLCEECLLLLEDITKEKLPREILWVEPKVAYSEAEGIFRENLRGVYALLLPIVVADNYSAVVNRKGKKTTLGMEIFDVLGVRRWDFARDFSGGL